jgi:UDP-N-acetylmuramate--alanine ligase
MMKKSTVFTPGSRLHFIGIGGIGMSALAQMCAGAGFKVSGSDRGCDRPENRRIFDKLELQDIKIYPQDGSFAAAGKVDFLIYSTAIEEDNPDFQAAGDTPRLHRSQALSEMIVNSEAEISIAVTGSCGKSTVTAYLAETLLNLGEDPACLNGALVNRFSYGRFAGNYRSGGGKYLVFEADESDKSLVNYAPDYAIILNIGTDHYEEAELIDVFAEFLTKVKTGVVLSRQVFKALAGRIPTNLTVRVFESEIGDRGDFAVTGYHKITRTDAVYVNGRRARLAPSGDRAAIDAVGVSNMLNIYGMRYEECRIETNAWAAEFADGSRVVMPQPGEHNALNALAIYALLRMIGFDGGDVTEALERFDGVWRRFNLAGITPSGAKVYDDYAHNPEKIAAALKTAIGIADNRVYAVFQPHGYAPLAFMREALFRCVDPLLRREDRFIMLEPYYAGGTSSFKPTSAEVVADYRSMARNKRHYLHFADRETLTDFLLLQSKPGDAIIIMGARDNSLSDYAVSLTAK